MICHYNYDDFNNGGAAVFVFNADAAIAPTPEVKGYGAISDNPLTLKPLVSCNVYGPGNGAKTQ